MLTINQRIDAIAHVGKIGVELSFLNETEKEYIKQRIDLGAEALKLINTILSESSPAHSTEDISKAAQRYGVKKVVALPYVDGVRRIVFFKVYGGDPIGFYNATGIKLLNDVAKEPKSYIQGLLEAHGKVIYEQG